MPKHSKKKHMKGKGILEDFQKFPISTIASYALPSLLGSAGATSGGEIGLLAGPVGGAVGAAAGGALGSYAGKVLAQDLRRRGVGMSNKRSMLGGAMNQMNPDLSGMTQSSNGTYQRIPPRMKGMGQTSAYGIVSSEFGRIAI
jgi:hypothetical protein